MVLLLSLQKVMEIERNKEREIEREKISASQVSKGHARGDSWRETRDISGIPKSRNASI